MSRWSANLVLSHLHTGESTSDRPETVHLTFTWNVDEGLPLTIGMDWREPVPDKLGEWQRVGENNVDVSEEDVIALYEFLGACLRSSRGKAP